MLIKMIRICRFALQNFWRNVWLSMVTVSIIVLAFLSVNLFILAHALLDTSLQAIEKKVNLSIYFKQSVQEDDVQQLITRLQQLSEKPDVTYISRDKALERLKERYEKDGNKTVSDSLAILDSNPLTASLIIHAKTIEDYPAIQVLIAEEPFRSWIGQKKFEDSTLLIQRIHRFKANLRQIGSIVLLFFAIVASLIVYNTIRITIYTRQKEISIMKLVGATNWFIRAPLIIESMFYSFIGLLVAVAILYPLLGFAQQYIDKFFEGQAFDVLAYFTEHFSTIFGYQLLASLLLNIFSSSIAIGRYLRV